MISPEQLVGKNSSHLVECQAGYYLMPDVCRAYTKMQAQARKHGIDLQIVSSHRDFFRQLHIWNAKWQGHKAVLDINESPLDIKTLTALEKARAILTWSALPGASRHHWGTDLDVYDKQRVTATGHAFELVNAEYNPDGPCYELACWLKEYARDFGFTLPYQDYTGGIAIEPWHLSYQPIADEITTQLHPEVLLDALREEAVEGLACIEDNIQLLFQQFVLNKGTQ